MSTIYSIGIDFYISHTYCLLTVEIMFNKFLDNVKVQLDFLTSKL